MYGSPDRPAGGDAGWSAQHRAVVLGGWAVVLVVALALGNALGSSLTDGHPGMPAPDGAGQFAAAARWCWSRLSG